MGGGGSAYPLEDLLPPDVLQPAIQLFDLLYDGVDFALVLALDLARLADRHVHREFHSAQHVAGSAEPAMHTLGRGARRREAKTVQARVGSTEGEFGGRGRGLCGLSDNAVVVVKGLFDGEVDVEIRRGGKLLGLDRVGFGFVCSCGNEVLEFVAHR